MKRRIVMTSLLQHVDPVAVMIVLIVTYAGLNFWQLKKLGGYMKEISNKFDALQELGDSEDVSAVLKDYPSFLLSTAMLAQSMILFPLAVSKAKGFLDRIDEILTNHEEYLKKI